MYFDSIIAGFGGQGVLLMGNLLAYAAMEEKKRGAPFPSGSTALYQVKVRSNRLPVGSPKTRRE